MILPPLVRVASVSFGVPERCFSCMVKLMQQVKLVLMDLIYKNWGKGWLSFGAQGFETPQKDLL